MAALLKKRALAEFSQVLQEEPPKPLKKLCISKKPAPQKTIDVADVLKSGSSTDVIMMLIQLTEAVPTQPEEVLGVYRCLLERFPAEKESTVRAKLAAVAGQLVRGGALDPGLALDDLAALLRSETSHGVLAALVDALHAVGLQTPGDRRLRHRAVQLARQGCPLEHGPEARTVSGSSYAFGNYNIGFIKFGGGRLTARKLPIIGFPNERRTRDFMGHICLQLRLHSRGLRLDLSLYEHVTSALDDDYESVRIAALKLLEVLSHIYSDHLVRVRNSQEQIRLADDAFAKICQMIGDLSMNGRAQPDSFQGTMDHVSSHFLEQTLDKKLMSNLRRKRSAHERQKESYESGEWSSGQKWADDAPREELDAQSVSLMGSGACGAFVHGLEDEFLEVRLATLDSLCKLALKFHSFAAQSLDFIVDMFNDEIEEVRLKAIQCLGRISNQIVLREDQLETILAVLEDFSMDIREALHEVLGGCCLSTKEGLKACVDNLLENLKRYPQDKRSLWRCLRLLGTKHPYLVLPLVPELLGIHPYFDLPEPDVEDPAYISTLILVFNAAAGCPTMMPLFEEHTLRHYSYLKDSFPSLVPQLTLPNQQSQAVGASSPSLAQSHAFLHQVLERVSAAELKQSVARQNWLETAIRDLRRLSEIEPRLTAAADCAGLYVRCQLLLAKILSNKSWLNFSAASPLQSNALKSLLEQLLQQTLSLNHQFLGLERQEEAALRQLRLRALALQLVVVIRGSNSSALGLCEAFLDQVELLQAFLEQHSLEPDPFTTAMLRDMDALEEPKPGSVARVLQPLLQEHACPTLRLPGLSTGLERIKQTRATLYEPAGETDLPHKFTAGLVLAITLDAEIDNVWDVGNVRVKVKYPDKQVQLILPRLADFRQLEDFKYRLYTSVLLSHSVWSEALHVEVGLVLDFADTDAAQSKGSQKTGLGLRLEDHTIELCRPVKVFVAPKPIKKGL
ncbi:integrator complex subunit, putative [Ixodes scapularis]|uniref:Integrator complex subunit, putative n=1 Tax=Ixodes scapularis TaxID=6945 RepID=B7QNR7_IXOSC|nr:integrator complex subunit, putative [Ixodes scapularis]|eukprot:XP_002416572.1 integrator complex subunit, putative [Ixodes scapularis]